jgi:hypothetical protein
MEKVMSEGSNAKEISPREISLGDGFGEVAVKANGIRIELHADGSVDAYTAGAVKVHPAANDTAAKPKAALKAHEVGEHLKDGTVCIAVDLKNDNALFAPEGIFGGNAKFDDQDEVVEKVNAGNGTHGHKDWRRITDAEGKTLSEVWNKVAPPALQGRAAPWFWLASPYDDFNGGRVRRGGEAGWYNSYRNYSLPVPVVRSGPARS